MDTAPANMLFFLDALRPVARHSPTSRFHSAAWRGRRAEADATKGTTFLGRTLRGIERLGLLGHDLCTMPPRPRRAQRFQALGVGRITVRLAAVSFLPVEVRGTAAPARSSGAVIARVEVGAFTEFKRSNTVGRDPELLGVVDDVVGAAQVEDGVGHAFLDAFDELLDCSHRVTAPMRAIALR